MRAVVVREFGGIENASLGDMPKPAPKAGEVLLERRLAEGELLAIFRFSWRMMLCARSTQLAQM